MRIWRSERVSNGEERFRESSTVARAERDEAKSPAASERALRWATTVSTAFRRALS